MGLSLSRTRNNVYEQRAQLGYTASLDVSGVNISSTSYSASSDKGNISYSFNNGILSVSGLSRGSKYWITAQVTYNYWWTETVMTPNGPITNTYTGWKSYSDSIDIYTHPGSFSMGATSDTSSSNSIIHNVLSADKINNEWIPRVQQAYHWYNQSDDKNYNTSPLRVVSNELVTATWFSECMKAMNAVGKEYNTEYSGGPNGTIITADLINQMNFSGYA